MMIIRQIKLEQIPNFRIFSLSIQTQNTKHQTRMAGMNSTFYEFINIDHSKGGE
jgi:hypothetical protein